MTRPRIVVVGGGVIGLSAACSLARRGASVVVLERAAVAAGASYGNAGTISAGHPPLNKPGRVRRALRQMLDPTSPLYIHPSWNPALWRWLWTFARNCTWRRVAECMDVMAPLGREALRLFDELVQAEEMKCQYRACGYYDVCRTEAGLADARHEAELVRERGYHPQILSDSELREVEPSLGVVRGGIFYPEAALVHPLEFMRELAAAVRRMGVEIREGVEVSDVTLRGGEADGVSLRDGGRVGGDAVVLATGPFSLGIAHRFGVHLPVQPGKGYHRDIEVGPAGAPALSIACVLHETSVFCTPYEGYVRFAGTMEFSGLNDVMRRPRLEQLTRAARTYFPALGAAAPLSEWCGLRPVSADGLPFVGPLPGAPNLVVATGHGMLGLTLGPATGELVADWLLADGPDPLYRAMAPARTRMGGDVSSPPPSR